MATDDAPVEPGDDSEGEFRHTTGMTPELEAERRASSGAKPGRMPDPFPGQFRLVRLLGEGAFGKVFLADDLALGRQVALKTLKLPATSTYGPQVLAALRKEARHLARLDHPHIVRVHAWLESGQECFLVLQFVPGGSLADRMKRQQALGWQEAARYVADVGEALVIAHEQGVIHRDIKPENILWDAERDEALLTDFGVAALLAEPGTMAGTPMYMAPEGFEGQVSPSLDVYSLAVTLFRLSTGHYPFPRSTVTELVQQKHRGLPDVDPRYQSIPETLERLIRSGMAANPDDRPRMSEFVTALRGSLNHLLADELATPAAEDVARPVNLRVIVSRELPNGLFQPVAATKPISVGPTRDMKKVPRSQDQLALRTGDRVRIEVVADQAGHVTVFNIGPTGHLNLLCPDDLSSPAPRIDVNRPLHVIDVEMTPPTGHERLFALWSKEPLRLTPKDLPSLVGTSASTSPAHATTRDMKKLQTLVKRPGLGDCQVVTLGLEHRG